MSQFQVLFLCTGNTCRSPMAEGILRSHLEDKGIDNINVLSAGTNAIVGFGASQFAVEAARAWGIDISAHRSRQIDKRLIEKSDLILAMTPEHVQYVHQISSDAAGKTYLLKGFPRPYSSSQEIVADPIGGFLEEYNQTFLELDEILRRIEGDIIGLAQS
jgi:protein-tyrosine-phosphatase